MHEATKKGFVFRWGKAQEESFAILKDKLTYAPLVQLSNFGGARKRIDGHFGAKKTEDVLATHFFWPKMRRDVERFVARCTSCSFYSLDGYFYGLCFRIA